MNKKKHPKESQFNVRVKPDELRRIKAEAALREQSVSEYVRSVLEFIIRPTAINNP